MTSSKKVDPVSSLIEDADIGRSHFIKVGLLVPTNNRKAFRVLREDNGKQVFIGLIKKEDLVRSIESKPMLVVEISRFDCQSSKDKSIASIYKSCGKSEES